MAAVTGPGLEGVPLANWQRAASALSARARAEVRAAGCTCRTRDVYAHLATRTPPTFAACAPAWRAAAERCRVSTAKPSRCSAGPRNRPFGGGYHWPTLGAPMLWKRASRSGKVGRGTVRPIPASSMSMAREWRMPPSKASRRKKPISSRLPMCWTKASPARGLRWSSGVGCASGLSSSFAAGHAGRLAAHDGGAVASCELGAHPWRPSRIAGLARSPSRTGAISPARGALAPASLAHSAATCRGRQKYIFLAAARQPAGDRRPGAGVGARGSGKIGLSIASRRLVEEKLVTRARRRAVQDGAPRRLGRHFVPCRTGK